MTKAERSDLLKVCRGRERVARAECEKRAARLRAEFETQLATVYHYEQDPTWRALFEEADAAVMESDRRLARRCREMGIPAKFRPLLNASWYGRGHSASKERQAELRRMAYAQIDHIEPEAKAEIARASVDAQTGLLADGLESDASKKWLETLPTPEARMPTLALADIEKKLPLKKTPGPEIGEHECVSTAAEPN